MAITLPQANGYIGQGGIGNTPQNKGECVGWVSVFNDSYGVPHVWGNAINLIANAPDSSFDKGTSYPAPAGATACYGIPFGRLADGSYAGHTGISLGDGRLIQQNDPVGSAISVKSYGPGGYQGWYRPKNYAQFNNGGGDEMKLNDELTDSLYREYLGRPAYQSDLDGNRGGDVGALVLTLKRSQDHRDYLDFQMNSMYRGALQRPEGAEPSALENGRGAPRRDLFAAILNSDEAARVTKQWKAGASAVDVFDPYTGPQLYIKKPK